MADIRLNSPRCVVAGLSGDGGKTLLSLGLTRSLRDRGLQLRTAKKGPDYIDAAWLSAASGAGCVNLDTFLMSREGIGSAAWSLRGADVVVIEGNRGLYDGSNPQGTHSTAELAKLLKAPVLLVVNVTKATRTIAALVLGCQQLDQDLNIGGVVLNRVGTARQEALIRRAVEDSTGIPVLGAIPRLDGEDPLPGRHLGLVTVAEHPQCERSIAVAAEAVANHVDLERVVEMARLAPPVELPLLQPDIERVSCRVGYLSDSAFSFYYPENLECLRKHGVELVEVVPTTDCRLPDVDAIYIGGGFPEVHAERLARCDALAKDLRKRVTDGMPVYAECGGLMFLGRELRVNGSAFPMTGVLDLVVEQRSKPQGHGYEVAVVDRDNPFFETGTRLAGHEFHYSRVVGGEDLKQTVLSVDRGHGVGDARDGIVKGNVWASYLHLHALATPRWAEGFLEMAACHAAQRSGSAVECV